MAYLDLTKRQLSYIIEAMSWRLQRNDITETICDSDSWSVKGAIAHEYADRCDLLAMLDKTFNSAVEEQD